MIYSGDFPDHFVKHPGTIEGNLVSPDIMLLHHVKHVDDYKIQSILKLDETL